VVCTIYDSFGSINHLKIKRLNMKLFTILLLSVLTFSVTAQEQGEASYYNDLLQGNKTASGEPYDKNELTAAHKTLPFGTVVKVTRLDNQKSTIVRINDRGPYRKGRILDLSRKAAEEVDMLRAGVVKVKVEVLEPRNAPLLNNTPKPTTTSAPVTSTIEAPKPVRKKYTQYGLYKIQLSKPEKKGFGVQVGTYSSYDNAMKIIADLQAKWFDNILLKIEPGTGGNDNFKIILGQYPTKAAAENYRKNLQRKHSIKGFTIELADK